MNVAYLSISKQSKAGGSGWSAATPTETFRTMLVPIEHEERGGHLIFNYIFTRSDIHREPVWPRLLQRVLHYGLFAEEKLS